MTATLEMGSAVQKGFTEQHAVALTKEIKLYYRLVLVSLVLIMLSTSTYLMFYPNHISCDCGSQPGKIYKIDHKDNMPLKLQPGDSLVYSGQTRPKRDVEDLILDADEQQCVLADIPKLESFDKEVYQRLLSDNPMVYDAAAECMQYHIDAKLITTIGTCFNDLQKEFEQQSSDEGLKVPHYMNSKMNDDAKPECISGWEKVLKNAMQAFDLKTRAIGFLLG